MRRTTVSSHDWDEVKTLASSVYCEHEVYPRSPREPDATMHLQSFSNFSISRFGYGAPLAVSGPTSETDSVLVFTSVRESAQHTIGNDHDVRVPPGRSIVRDLSRTTGHINYESADHLQLILTLSHSSLAHVAHSWWGAWLGDEFWRTSPTFGGIDSSWHRLLSYASCEQNNGPFVGDERWSSHIGEMLMVQLLREWARCQSFDMEVAPNLGPGYVRRAASFIEENAKDAPTLAEVANAVGVSVRTLTTAFRRYLNTTPAQFQREVRLQGIRRDIIAFPHQPIVSIIGTWGYVNAGQLAQAYHRRFGETPSRTRTRVC